MRPHVCYHLILWPRGEEAATCPTLAEAAAWMRGYNEAMRGSERQASVADQPPSPRRPRRLRPRGDSINRLRARRSRC